MTRAVIYTRVSSKAQEDGYSLDAQKQDGQEYCDKHGYEVVAIESDTFTGHDSLEQRDGMQRAIRLIRTGAADVLVIWRIDRAGRFTLDNLLILRDVTEAGGRLESVTEGPISNTADGKLLYMIKSHVGESEWEHIGQLAKMGVRERIGKGLIMPSNVPLFGYTFAGEHKNTYQIDEEAAKTIRDIYNKSDQGWAVRAITRYLNEQSIPTGSMLLQKRGELPKGRKLVKLWSPQRVLDILSCESYTGRHSARHYQKVVDPVTKKKRRVARPESDSQRVFIQIPAIISEEQWARVHEKVTARQLSWGKGNDTVLLNNGFGICGICGSKMITRRRRGGTGPKYRWYTCSKHSGTPIDPSLMCPGRAFAVRCSEVDDDIWDKVTAILQDGPKFNRLVQSKSAKLAEKHEEAVRRAENVQAELSDMQARQATVYERMTYETDEYIRAQHRTELQRLNETVAGLEKRAREAQSMVEATRTREDAHQRLLEAVRRNVEHYQQDPAAQVRMQESLKQIGADPAKHSLLVESLPGIIDEHGLTREQKRDIMRTLDVHVVMYPKDSDFARQNEHRWDFRFSDPDPMCLTAGSPQQSRRDAAVP
jgi:site-specific DNA recombinase